MATKNGEPQSPSTKDLPTAPEKLLEEVKDFQSVKLRQTEPQEKIVLPTEEDISMEKHQQMSDPILKEVTTFNRNSLQHQTPNEKTGLTNAKIEYEIGHFDKEKLKPVTPTEKHEVVAIADEAGAGDK